MHTYYCKNKQERARVCNLLSDLNVLWQIETQSTRIRLIHLDPVQTAAPDLLRACELTCVTCFHKRPEHCKTCAVNKAITKATGKENKL